MFIVSALLLYDTLKPATPLIAPSFVFYGRPM